VFRSLLFASSALAFVVSAHAQQPPPAAAASNAQDEEIVVTKTVPAKKKRVCKREMATGSIMMKTVCRTQEEEEAITAQSQATLDQMKRDQEGMANMRRANDGGDPQFRNASCSAEQTRSIRVACSPTAVSMMAEIATDARMRALRNDQTARCGLFVMC